MKLFFSEDIEEGCDCGWRAGSVTEERPDDWPRQGRMMRNATEPAEAAGFIETTTAWSNDMAGALQVADLPRKASAARMLRRLVVTLPARPLPVEPVRHPPAETTLRQQRATPHFVSLPMFAADLITTNIACATAYAAARLFTDAFGQHELATVSLVLFIPIAIGNLMTGLYPGAGLNPVVEFRQLSRVAGISFLGAASLGFLSRLPGAWCLFFAIAGLLQLGIAPLMRAVVRQLARKQSWWGYPVIIFGAGEAATTVVTNLLRHPEYGLRPVVVLDPDGESSSVCGVPVVGKPRLASVVAKRMHIRYAIVALPDLSRAQVTRIIERNAQGIRHVMITSAISPFAPGLPILWRDTRDLAGVAGVEVRNRLLVPTARGIKRAIDLVLTSVGGFCLIPLLAVLAILVKLSSRGPVFFCHRRLGERGKYFCAWKFRSMVTNGDEVLQAHLAADPVAREEWTQDQKLKDDPRVTRVGRFMRKTSLDELPQLWNVLCGEMSLVGPRPIVKDEIAKYGKCYSIYKSVRPGITGLWQVSGRNDTTYDERLEYDKYYVRNWSPWLDTHILARTVATLICGRGAY